MSYCHHFSSVVRRLSSVVRRLSSVVRRLSSVVCRLSSVNISHFNLLLRNHWANCNQTLVEWSLDIPLPTKIAAKLKIEKRGDEILIVHCCFSISQMSSNFNCSYMAMSSLTYIPGFSVKFFFQPIYTDYAN